MSKTTIAGVLVALAGVGNIVAQYLTSGTIDGAAIATAVVALLAAFGLYKAKDQK